MAKRGVKDSLTRRIFIYFAAFRDLCSVTHPQPPPHGGREVLGSMWPDLYCFPFVSALLLQAATHVVTLRCSSVCPVVHRFVCGPPSYPNAQFSYPLPKQLANMADPRPPTSPWPMLHLVANIGTDDCMMRAHTMLPSILVYFHFMAHSFVVDDVP